jgi:hypothetical protein
MSRSQSYHESVCHIDTARARSLIARTVVRSLAASGVAVNPDLAAYVAKRVLYALVRSCKRARGMAPAVDPASAS